MNPEATQLDHPEARDRLLLEATRLFSQKGYAATSVSEIVGAAGVSKPVLYYHFGNKEGIYLAIVERSQQTVAGLLSEAVSLRGSAQARLMRMVETAITHIIDNIDVLRLIILSDFSPPGAAPTHDREEFRSQFFGFFRGVVAEGVATGEFKGEVEDITALILSVMQSGLINNVMHHPRKPTIGKRELHRMLRIAFAGILAEGENAERGSPE